ncbi:tRNA lysidine(34) synthetase TilS [Endozoicomonas sp. SCSIO W0465]|uniref:tRNA lysidine(34) synthetase TilS n=1 Tax=Endozoicomonas sp. SCSIO W0465 TaxID=2918516 RepID=UPI002074E658|nr:tRNA lysidine(34) synthetase TilS [Endozoicomonas sp. SCSIO W0465]USE34010.1 tRNA lysidine(34) synthetase TilS [Endozoicomonas sp. SCSIO W0465]
MILTTRAKPIAKNSSEITSCYPLSPEWVLGQLSSRLPLPVSECPLTVAFSGGVDSTALLHLLICLRDKGRIAGVRAVHVHHGLSGYADQWAEHCQSVCKQWKVPLTVARVSLDHAAGYGLEQAARDARYRVFVNAVKQGGCLLQGHHRDDQAETVLLRLFRGTGVDGVQGMPEKRSLGNGLLFRPLLNVPRSAIEVYARSNNLQSIEDDSNIDERFSRNFLRQRLIPMVEARWPGASARLVEFARDVGQMNQSLEQQTRVQLDNCIDYRPQWLLDQQPLINLATLQSLDASAQRRVIRRWLKLQGVKPPTRETLEQIFNEVVGARNDAGPLLKISARFTLTRYQQMLVVLDEEVSLQPFEPMLWDWQKEPVLVLGGRALICNSGQAHDGKTIRLPQKTLQLKRRCHISGDEKFAITGRQGRKTLKKWLQDYKVPPWLREYLPLVFDDDRMVAAPGLWSCVDDRSGNADGISLSWKGAR